jgi:hypothetical protein
VETGQEIHCFRGNGIDLVCVAVSPDGRWLLSADHTGRELRLWNVEDRKQVDQLSWGSEQPVFGCFTPDGRQAIWGGTDGVVRVYRLTHPDGSTPTVSAAGQSDRPVVAASPGLMRPAIAAIAVVPLVAFVCSRRRRRSGKPRAPDVSLMDPDLMDPRVDHSQTPSESDPGWSSALKGPARGMALAADHPDPTILALFVAGRLPSNEMERLGDHVAVCPVCLEALEQLPEDSMVHLLRDLPSEIDGALPAVSAAPPPDEGFDRAPREPFEHPLYRVKSLIAPGGMGLTYLADDLIEGRLVVLKFLREDLLAHPRLVERFRREATAATLLKHPNIVDVFGAETFGPWPALVMEYIRGTDLARLLEKNGPVPIRVGCEVVRQAAVGLQHSFEHGMVHRDVKPSNLMLGHDGTVKILDFGLARMHRELSSEAVLTSTGAFLGSVDFIAPERADDPRVADIRADIYSLGCTFYHLMTGTTMFQGTILQVLEAHHTREASPLDDRRPDVPAGLAAVVARMLAKAPDERYQTPVEVAQSLKPFTNGLA